VVFGLFAMAVWTLVVKFLAPGLWWAAERAAGRTPPAAPIMWDFWWIAHLALARLLWLRHRWAFEAALAVGTAEVLVVLTKLVLFARAPDTSFWGLLWLTNKLYVLAFFLLVLALLATRRFRRALAGVGSDDGAPAPTP
jgi:hypothetical protein